LNRKEAKLAKRRISRGAAEFTEKKKEKKKI
jgi:hypothetical protein